MEINGHAESNPADSLAESFQLRKSRVAPDGDHLVDGWNQAGQLFECGLHHVMDAHMRKMTGKKRYGGDCENNVAHQAGA